MPVFFCRIGIFSTIITQVIPYHYPLHDKAPGATNTEGLGRSCPTKPESKMNKS